MEPTFEEYMLPVLKAMADKKVRENKEIRPLVLSYTKLDSAQLTEKQKSGNYKYQDNINFAISYLPMAGCLTRQKKGVYLISDTGLKVASKNLISIDVLFLCELSPEFKDRITNNHNKKSKVELDNKNIAPSNLNPLDQSEESERIYRETKKYELLEILKSNSDDSTINKERDYSFERIYFDLLINMGYGTDGDVTKKSGDGGIDSIILGDNLGFERIACQSKRWNYPVGRKDVSQFVGDFEFSKCTKDVFITTSYFQPEASRFAETHKNLVLIDGEQLVELMYKYNVGVSKRGNPIEIKDIDSDYFKDFSFID